MNREPLQPQTMPVVGIPDVRLAVCGIDRSPERGMRRERELQAVRSLLDFFFGPDARYCHRPDGSPYVEGCNEFISVSHSLDFAAMVVADFPGIGIDIEQHRPAQLRRVADRFLSDAERRVFTTDSTLLWAWCAKEAVYKAAGVPGLSGPDIELSEPFCREARVGDRRFALSTLYSLDHCIVVASPSYTETTALKNDMPHTENTEDSQRKV